MRKVDNREKRRGKLGEIKKVTEIVVTKLKSVNHLLATNCNAAAWFFKNNQFQVSHMRNYKMQMRMGIHSGSCVGGVVGSKMPHFSVFGDTVNIAALMESTSEPMRVQISHTTMVSIHQSQHSMASSLYSIFRNCWRSWEDSTVQ